ncbi:quercetin dioxygenase-like cupin family protein [Caldalkalibacillus uzonensis]|uniref:Quercetin dioxygenase-like cupin family protein n=1 Tax=Caldalkalibacillus uzonensis TaxID=353224 RepID=A0ABU0CUQ0_9BACI|nr:cupin domain-containing protein [Caldalkalibacillus uzonensis]MDQ0338747.1 quercetin dioxygenase-like cupin family protein [Caldalkalibacillus uzonensis]
MKIISVKDVPPDQTSPVTMKKLFTEEDTAGGRITFGVVTIPPGERVPVEGLSIHDQDEYALVLKGSIRTMSAGKEVRVARGQATFIPAGEAHWAYNDGDEECEIVWALVRR